MSLEEVRRIAEKTGGNVEQSPALTSSGFALSASTLAENHWLVAEGENEPPMFLRMGVESTISFDIEGPAHLSWHCVKFSREAMAYMVREAAKYALRASTMNGKAEELDPDVFLRNIVVGLLGYWTGDGKRANELPDRR